LQNINHLKTTIMSFTGNEGDYISLTDGSSYTAAYRAANPGSTQGHFFGSTKIKALLAQSGCVGLRFYHGIDTNGLKQLVVVGVDKNENDLTTGASLILDKSVLCPPNCGPANSLNS
jgi:hypothetical protein